MPRIGICFQFPAQYLLEEITLAITLERITIAIIVSYNSSLPDTNIKISLLSKSVLQMFRLDLRLLLPLDRYLLKDSITKPIGDEEFEPRRKDHGPKKYQVHHRVGCKVNHRVRR